MTDSIYAVINTVLRDELPRVMPRLIKRDSGGVELFYTVTPSKREIEISEKIVSRFMIVQWGSIHIIEKRDDPYQPLVSDLTNAEKVDAILLAKRTYNGLDSNEQPTDDLIDSVAVRFENE